jgi:integration host factor subunit beta
MTKSELIEAVAEKASIPKARGEGIELRGFGSFSVRNYEAYAGRNPKTGEPVEVKPKKLPFFKVAKELKARVDAGRARHSLTPEAPGEEEAEDDRPNPEDREASAE